MSPFHVNGRISASSNCFPQDILAAKTALHRLGFYEMPDYGLTDFPDRRLMDAITAFQKARGLRVDGAMRPEGETETAIQGDLSAVAERLRELGRYGDTILAHITPEEAEFLHRVTDGGTINPATGLPEFFDFGGIFSGIGEDVSNAFQSFGNGIGSIFSGNGDTPKPTFTMDLPDPLAATSLQPQPEVPAQTTKPGNGFSALSPDARDQHPLNPLGTSTKPPAQAEAQPQLQAKTQPRPPAQPQSTAWANKPMTATDLVKKVDAHRVAQAQGVRSAQPLETARKLVRKPSANELKQNIQSHLAADAEPAKRPQSTYQDDLHTHFESQSGMPPVPLSTELKADMLEFGGRNFGREQAARALNHYRAGSGEDLRMPAEWLQGHRQITDAEESNHKWVENELQTNPEWTQRLTGLRDGQTLTIPFNHTYEDIYARDGSDLHYASGKSNLETQANLNVTRKGDRLLVTGTQNYNWFDPYDWQPGTRFFKGMVTGDEMNKLETHGKARRFKMHGDWPGTVSGEIPLKPGGGLGSFELKWAPRHIEPGP
ncbi:MAG: peptidoglycan-binding protein [Alphaproteobacteria bacterium]|nr:peptidoglycan-binding protein [Alphaproteobacteria bacterium]